MTGRYFPAAFLPIHQPAQYIIVVGSHVSAETVPARTEILHTFGYAADGTPVTVLEGQLSDQAALHSILTWVRDRGLTLYQVRWQDTSSSDSIEEIQEGA